jgi:hypothetical protein
MRTPDVAGRLARLSEFWKERAAGIEPLGMATDCGRMRTVVVEDVGQLLVQIGDKSLAAGQRWKIIVPSI